MADKYDIQLIPDVSGDVTFEVRGKSADTGLMLLQRLYVLMFAEYGAEYRGGDDNTGLLALLDGANTPPDDLLTAVVNTCRSYALSALDPEDLDNIASFSCAGVDGAVDCELTLEDGTSIHGTLKTHHG